MAGKKIYPLTDPLTTEMRFAIVGNADKFRKKKHAWKVWKTLKSFRCVVYPIAPGMDRLEGSKVYDHLSALKSKVDVAVVCLLPEESSNLIAEAVEAEVQYLWFQEQTYNEDLIRECAEKGIEVIKGCVLQHKNYTLPFGVFHPCYWHGKGSNKVKCKWS